MRIDYLPQDAFKQRATYTGARRRRKGRAVESASSWRQAWLASEGSDVVL